MKKLLFLALLFAGFALQAQPDKVYTSLNDVKHPDQVYRLRLNYKFLKKIPPEVFAFTNLRVLDLSKNRIDTIPPAIARLSNLEILKLARNNIRQVPDSLGYLLQLKTLDLSRNPILDLPESLSQLTQLEYLVIWMTGVVSLPPACFTLNYSLKEIDMRACPMTYDDQQAIETLIPTPRKRWYYVCNCQ